MNHRTAWLNLSHRLAIAFLVVSVTWALTGCGGGAARDADDAPQATEAELAEDRGATTTALSSTATTDMYDVGGPQALHVLRRRRPGSRSSTCTAGSTTRATSHITAPRGLSSDLLRR